ncbi:MAG: GAF domain-containing sensor histidine kinase [Chloroflexi bacterium]|nr:GAF domain-containing sensor histidine kinase [Chloroflexota bacterium]
MLRTNWRPAVSRFLFGRESARENAAPKNLWQAGLAIAAAENHGEVLRAVANQSRQMLNSDAAAVCLLDEESCAWQVQGISGAREAFDVNASPFGRGGKADRCPVVRSAYRDSQLAMPILRAQRVAGCLCVADQTPRDYSAPERAHLRGIADQAALALDHARRIEREATRAATQERERLAREMHDTLAQVLGLVSIKSQAAREFLAQGDAAQVDRQLEQLATLAQKMYADTRESILGLRTDVTPEHGLVTALESYIEWFSELSGVPTTLDAREMNHAQFPLSVQAQLVRVVQEALSNVRRHARARSASVVLARAGEFAQITIEDDGVGFDPNHLLARPLPHVGLCSMRERVESVGGKFWVDSASGQGTRVQIEIPIVYRGEA